MQPQKLIKFCLYCNKQRGEASHFNDGPDRVVTLECGHSVVESLAVNVTEEETLRDKIASIISLKGKKPYPFQVDGVLFAAKANFRAGIFDEMGLGKTVQACLSLKIAPDALLPCIILCKSTLKAQWLFELTDWTGMPAQIVYSSKDKPIKFFEVFIVSLDLLDNLFSNGNTSWQEMEFKSVIIDECQLIKNPEAKRTKALRNLLKGNTIRKRIFSPNLPQRQKIEMIANDLMSYHRVSENFILNFENLGPHKLGLTECKCDNNGIIKGRITISTPHAENDDEDKVIETILHEIAHAITPGAGHRLIWSDTCRKIGGNGEAFASCAGSEDLLEAISIPKHTLALSGTPIKNNALEYFTILNILAPGIFYNKDAYERYYVDHVSSGRFSKPAGIVPHMEKEFKNKTADFIIRRTRDEVLPDLPKINRTSQLIELSEDTKKKWERQLHKFSEFYDELGGEDGIKATDTVMLLEQLSILRHLTGLAKIDPICEDVVIPFLQENDRKLVIFHHHRDVGAVLFNRLSPVCEELGIEPPLLLNPSTPQRDYYVGNCAAYGWVENRSTHRLLIASTLANSEGLNLQSCSDMIQMERQWNPANEEQAEGRFPRPGSIAQSISAIYATAIDTIDEWFSELVEKKRIWCKQTMGESVEYKWNESSLVKELAKICADKGRRMWSPVKGK